MLNKYYVPKLDIPDSSALGLPAEEITLLRSKIVKDFAKQARRMKAYRPKLYGLILDNMIVESRDKVSQEQDYEIWHNATNPEKLWQTIVKMYKVDCVSNVSQVKELTARKTYQTIKQGPFKSLAKCSKQFHETYQSYKKTSPTPWI
jgi:hypothetical protein